MDIAAFGVAVITAIALLVLGKRNISRIDVLPSQKRVQPIPVRVRTDDKRGRR